MKAKLLIVTVALLLCQLCHAQQNVLNASSEVKIYPNPAAGTLYVVVDTASKVTIFNLLGEPLPAANDKLVSAGRTGFDFTEVPQGYYLVQVLSRDEKYTKRILKE